eukprot:1161078-Pelagomonas_calceolata.AAC.26
MAPLNSPTLLGLELGMDQHVCMAVAFHASWHSNGCTLLLPLCTVLLRPAFVSALFKGTLLLPHGTL